MAADSSANRFISPPPKTAPTQLLGRVTRLKHDAGGLWTTGWFTLASGTQLTWIAHSYGVRRSGLFHPEARVVVTGHELGGPLYVTGIREATDAEWQDALDYDDRQPLRTREVTA